MRKDSILALGRTTLVAAGICAWQLAAPAYAQETVDGAADASKSGSTNAQGNSGIDPLDDLITTSSQPSQPEPSKADPSPTDSSQSASPQAEAAAQPAPAPAEPAQGTLPSEIAPAETASKPVDEKPLDTVPVSSLQKRGEEDVSEASSTRPRPSHQIEEIVVTATKREESIRDIPASISAFEGAKLEAQGKLNLDDFAGQTPGVTLAEFSPNFARVSMRGISTDTSGLAGMPSSTGFFIGDVAFSDPYVSNIQPDLSAFDLADVEILKGPQGTLFGGSAFAGAIRYVLNDPVMGEWQARGFEQYIHPAGGSTAWTTGVLLNAPLYKDRLAVRLGFVNHNYPGITDLTNHSPPQKDVDHGSGKQVRGILAWQPLDPLKVKLTHITQNYSTPDATVLDNPNQHTLGNQVLPQPVENNFSLDAGELTWNFSDMRFTSLTSRARKVSHVFADATAGLLGTTPPNGYPQQLAAFIYFDDLSRNLSQEFRLQSTGDNSFQWLAGIYAFDNKGYFRLVADTVAHQTALGNTSLLGNLLAGANGEYLYDKSSLLYAVSQPKADEYAFFFDLSDKFWDQLKLSAGARVYRTEVKGGFVGTGVLVLTSNNGMDVNFDSNDLVQQGINPKLTATWTITDDISVYGQVAKGFQFGGVNSTPATPGNHIPQVYKSSVLWNYETGLRTAWLDNSLQADITAFDIVYKNPQLAQSTTGNVINLSYTDNVGGATSRGLESSLLWVTPIGLMLSANAAYTDAHTTKAFTNSDGTVIKPGTQMPGAAKYQYSGEASYMIPLGNFVVGANVGYNFIGPGYADLIHSVAINDYGTLSAGLSFGSETFYGHPQLTVNCANILNTTGVVSGSRGKAVTELPTGGWTLNQPRTFTARISLAF